MTKSTSRYARKISNYVAKLPFGEEIGISTPQTAGRGTHPQYITDNIRQKFTGYERDNESGLEFAQERYYSNKFDTPIPKADIEKRKFPKFEITKIERNQ